MSGGASEKTERLLNLTLVLLGTRRPLDKHALRRMVPQYGTATTDEAFERMFERDKEELRELGIPIATEFADPLFETDHGYRIHQSEYALPQVDLTAEELAMVTLAARAWAQASLAGPAARALTKLRALGADPDEEALTGLEPRVSTSEPAFESVKDAVLDRRVLRFTYRRADGATGERHVEPWGLSSVNGRWYAVGLDLDRGAPRVFRLSRIVGPARAQGRAGAVVVPEDVDVASLIRDSVRRARGDGAGEEGTAVLRLRSGRGHALRRRGRLREAAEPGWDRLEMPYRSAGALVADVANHAPDVVIEEPVELVNRLRAHLEAVVAAHGGAS